MNPGATNEPGNRLHQILAQQRADFLHEGPPSLIQRRADLKKLRTAVLARRSEIEDVLISDFGHHSRHETAIMEIMILIQEIDYLYRNAAPLHAADPPARGPAHSGSEALASNISRSA